RTDTPVIGITAGAMEGDRQKCLDAGMNDYLSKPLMLPALAAMLAKWLPRSDIEHNRNGACGPSPSDLTSLLTIVGGGAWGSTFIDEISGVFLAEMEERLASISAQWSRGDMAGMATTAHAIKGSCSHFGAKAFMGLCATVESQAREGSVDGIENAVASI